MSEVARLRRLIDHAFVASLWHTVELTDAEFFHQPITPCWGVWKRKEAPRPHMVGSGDWVIDDDAYGPPLVPTIGWRLLHLALWTDVYREWTFGFRRPGPNDFDYPGTAAEAVAWLERAQKAFAREVHALGESDADDMRPTHNHRQRSVADLVWIIANEHIHHGAEIGLLRDLIRGSARTDYYPGPS